MILHLASDEKFVEGIIEFFEIIYPDKNKYLIGVNNWNVKLIYLKSLSKVQIIKYRSRECQKIIRNISQYEAVIVHYLDNQKAEIIRKAPDDVKFVWMIWGGDAYRLFDYKLYDEVTLEILSKFQRGGRLKRKIEEMLYFNYFLNKKKKIRQNNIYRAISRIKYCTTVLPSEFNIFKEKLPLSAIYVPFSYGIKDFIKAANELKRTKLGFNIIVGNSGAPSNNHLSVFKLLQGMQLGDRKVIVPLSYGSKEYIEEIKKQGYEILRDSFVPVTEFMPFDDYLTLLAGCSVCIMNHYRQQGMGNIIIVLWLGAKLYMRTENIAYQYLVENDAIIFPINNNEITFEALTNEQKQHNKMVIEKLYNRDLVIEKAKNLIRIISSDSKQDNQ
jgi:dTDP-N-acetylfucosamine:lipid II N-acetylfucosaminyltransferase